MKQSKLKLEIPRSSIKKILPGKRPGFTLIEILVATIILSLGLVGIAAIFPAVISQQQKSNDLTLALSASASGEALLYSQLPYFAAAIQDTNNGGLPAEEGWLRINAYDPDKQDMEPYLQAPSMRIRGKEIDLRLKVREYGFKVNVGSGNFNGSYLEFTNIKLPDDTLPIVMKDHRFITVNIVINGSILVKLKPRDDNPNLFKTVKPGDRMDNSPISNRPNRIDYDNGTVSFHVKRNVGETIDSITIDYAWRNDKIISHSDRLFPSINPRYAWDIAVRKGYNGNPQYSMFVYKFEGGPRDSQYYPDIPSRWLAKNEGMLRDGSATIVYDTQLKKAYLTNLSTEMENAVKSGIYVLPKDSTGPVKILRKVEDKGISNVSYKWELQTLPMQILPDGSVRTYPHNFVINHIYYMPLEVPAYDDKGNVIGTYKIKPLIAITKQFST